MAILEKGGSAAETSSRNDLTESEVIQSSDVLNLINGEFEYSHTDVVYRSGDKIFSGVSHERLGNDLPNLDEVTDIREVPMDVFPKYDQRLFGHIVEFPTVVECYLKQPSLLGFKGLQSSHIARLMTIEANLFKALRDSPHKNLTKYLGCVVKQGHVTAFCLPKYVETLGHRVRQKLYVDVDSCLADIRSAVLHLHSLGFAHNDINPENIMFDSEDVTVLIDFDASMPLGQNLLKAGTYGWNDNHSEVSDQANDFYALEQLEFYLLNESS